MSDDIPVFGVAEVGIGVAIDIPPLGDGLPPKVATIVNDTDGDVMVRGGVVSFPPLPHVGIRIEDEDGESLLVPGDFRGGYGSDWALAIESEIPPGGLLNVFGANANGHRTSVLLSLDIPGWVHE